MPQRPFLQKKLRSLLIFLSMFLVTVVQATPRYAYTVNYFDSSISRYRVDADMGMLHHLGQIKTLKSPASLVLHPSGKYLFVASQTVDFIAIYAVDQLTGKLTEIKGSPVPSRVRSVWQLGIDPFGRFLYVPGRFTKDLVVFKIAQETGALTPLTKQSLPTHGDRARFVEVTPNGRFVYVSNTFSNSLAAYQVAAEKNIPDGEKVTPIVGMPFAGGDAPERTMAHPNGKYLYLANWRSGDVITYDIDQTTGALTQQPGKPVETEGHFPFGGEVSPNGKYLYSVNWATSDISTFRIDEKTGALSLLPAEPLPTGGEGPLNIRIAPSGDVAYIPNYDDSSLSIFDVNKNTGALTDRRRIFTRPGVRQLAFLEGEQPVRVQPQFAIVGDAKQHTLNSFGLDASNGKWSPLAKLSIKTAAEIIAVTPQSDLVFVAAKGGQTVDVFRLDGQGKLSPLKEANLLLPGKLQSLFVEQNGHYLYTLSRDKNVYQAFAINHKSGQLTLAEQLFLDPASQPIQITIGPAGRYSFVLDNDANTLKAYRYLYADAPVMFEITRHGSPFGVGNAPVDMAIDPSGRYLLTANAGDDTVSVQLLPARLSPIKTLAGSTLATGKQPVNVVIHNSGRFAFVVNQSDASISGFWLEPDTGTLRQNGVAMPVGEQPTALEIDPSGHFAYLRYASRAGLTRFEVDVAQGRLVHPTEVLSGIAPSALAFTAIVR